MGLTFWKETGDALIVASAIMAGIFVLLYGLVAPFWRTPEGRNLMGVMATLFMGLAYYGWAVSQGGTPDGAYPIRAVLFGLLTAFLAQRVIVLIRAQLVRRKSQREVPADVE